MLRLALRTGSCGQLAATLSTVLAAVLLACGNNAGEPQATTFHWSGTYRWEDGVGLEGIRVVVWRDRRMDLMLAEDWTDAEGEYSLEWTSLCPPTPYLIAFWTVGWRSEGCTGTGAGECPPVVVMDCTFSPEGPCSPRPPHLPPPECVDSPAP
jgi:hypothetical protein